MPLSVVLDRLCEDCSDHDPTTELTLTADGERLCGQCLSQVPKCDDCHRHTRERTAVAGGPDVCQECTYNYNRCDDCDCYARDYFIVDGDREVCRNCRDEDYHECGDCYTWVSLGDRYCDDCSPPDAPEEVCDSTYKPTPIFHGTGPVYLGLELEMRTPGSAFTDAVDSAVAHLGRLGYLKEDGSITDGHGFELVTHPMSYRYARTRFPWRLLPRLRQLGAYTDTGVGIHVHISRAGFSSPAHVYRWLKFVYRNESAVTTLARRECSSWARFSPETRRRAADIAKGTRRGFDRYQAINTCPEHTFELRVFASSLEPQQVQAALAFADASVEYTRTLTAARITRQGGWQWDAFVTWLATRPDYAPLLAELTDLEALECAC
ncbi:amidoligase family protein [Nocardia sp. NPDC050435]|uniref:amidoligase family protein n=1 Tax=Nocardia sp. NPDC050435 TaxID=3155040 RepID=UPI0033E3512B